MAINKDHLFKGTGCGFLPGSSPRPSYPIWLKTVNQRSYSMRRFRGITVFPQRHEGNLVPGKVCPNL